MCSVCLGLLVVFAFFILMFSTTVFASSMRCFFFSRGEAEGHRGGDASRNGRVFDRSLARRRLLSTRSTAPRRGRGRRRKQRTRRWGLCRTTYGSALFIDGGGGKPRCPPCLPRLYAEALGLRGPSQRAPLHVVGNSTPFRERRETIRRRTRRVSFVLSIRHWGGLL